MLRCRSLIPGMVNTHGLTDDPMIILDAMDLPDERIVHGEVDKRHWGKEGKHHGRCRRGRRTFIAGDVPRMIAEREADLPLDDRLHQEAHDGEHRQRRNPFRFLQPYRADRCRVLAPAKARFHRDMWLLRGLEDLRTCTHLWRHGRG